MELNGKKEKFGSRLLAVIKALQARAEDLYDEEKKVIIPKAEWKDYKLQIVSHNNFPTAAGLASSASGFACFTQCLASLYGVNGDLTAIARQGSGSACRSLHAGWVMWRMGERKDGADSIAEQVKPDTHWEDIRILILVAEAGPKETPSTEGMQLSVETSMLLKHRAERLVHERLDKLKQAVINKDFQTFARLTMEDSNQFHAVCLDTYPPILYLNDTSRRVIHLVHALNEASGAIVAAYTFDAGPNAVIYTLKQHLPQVMGMFVHCFPPPKDAKQGSFIQDRLELAPSAQELKNSLKDQNVQKVLEKAHVAAGISSIIVSKVGEGAKSTPRQIHYGADGADGRRVKSQSKEQVDASRAVKKSKI